MTIKQQIILLAINERDEGPCEGVRTKLYEKSSVFKALEKLSVWYKVVVNRELINKQPLDNDKTE